MRSVLRGGIAWRALPHAYPPWQTVCHSFRLWRLDGSWARLSAILCAATRVRMGRRAEPTAAILDSQSAKTTEKGGPEVGRGQEGEWRTRHLLVDTAGLPLQVLVHPANIADRDGARAVLVRARARHPTLTRVWADAGYAGALLAWAKQELNLVVTIAKRPSRWVWTRADQEPAPLPAGFIIVPRRWVVERTFGWLGRSRRLRKDHEAFPTTEEAWIHLAMIGVMVKRLAQPPFSDTL